jgi:hypothetical protein
LGTGIWEGWFTKRVTPESTPFNSLPTWMWRWHWVRTFTPVVAPELFGFGDRRGPEFGAFGGGEVGEGLDAVGFDAGGEGEGTVGFAGGGVLQMEDGESGGLLSGFVGERAFTRLQRSGVRGVAGASAGFGGEGEGKEEEQAQAAHLPHYTEL